MAKKVLCEQCSALCCKYFALPIETPEDKGDYDDIRWYLYHKGITVFVEEGDWYISINNKCKHLSKKDNRCKIYDKRPRICRGYKVRTCDLVEGEYDYQLHLESDKQIEEYIKIKFADGAGKKRKTRRKRKKKR
jgi:Fe-S-cluster containining protein